MLRGGAVDDDGACACGGAWRCEDSLERVLRPNDRDLPFEQVAIVHEPRREAIYWVLH